jgi:hypothetical protein
MKSFASAAVLFNFLLNVIIQVSLEPTKLEAFASRPKSRVTWSSQVGRIDGAKTQAIVTALIIEEAGQSANRMRGIRIDLSNENTTDQIYLEEAKLEAIKKALVEIESGSESFRKEISSTPVRYYGAAEFWRPYQRIHTLNAAYYIRPESSGLSLSAYKDQEFRFPDHRPRELADLISRAIKELNQR